MPSLREAKANIPRRVGRHDSEAPGALSTSVFAQPETGLHMQAVVSEIHEDQLEADPRMQLPRQVHPCLLPHCLCPEESKDLLQRMLLLFPPLRQERAYHFIRVHRQPRATFHSLCVCRSLYLRCLRS